MPGAFRFARATGAEATRSLLPCFGKKLHTFVSNPGFFHRFVNSQPKNVPRNSKNHPGKGRGRGREGKDVDKETNSIDRGHRAPVSPQGAGAEKRAEARQKPPNSRAENTKAHKTKGWVECRSEPGKDTTEGSLQARQRTRQITHQQANQRIRKHIRVGRRTESRAGSTTERRGKTGRGVALRNTCHQ